MLTDFSDQSKKTRRSMTPKRTVRERTDQTTVERNKSYEIF